ncbi:hypothetical protein HELRODRAFT_177929 [Helobdella robusta]|uniref:Uncharacterized protein n=1 Tax=Helobdella robusta TaxID=6412 RepID=T1FCH3_HELRO|nr:hypothetical protein HELRODRAFT_177929 [Helobdella robusta]ESN97501.1 hypothetical protein HELRODRAFT_177929 [Helobdella robusta]
MKFLMLVGSLVVAGLLSTRAEKSDVYDEIMKAVLELKVEEFEKQEEDGEGEERGEVAGGNGVDQKLFECKKYGEKCSPFSKCCNGLRCNKQSGFTGFFKSARCGECGKQGQSCRHDSECCLGSDCSGVFNRNVPERFRRIIKLPVAFLQHGLLDSSVTWVINSRRRSLGTYLIFLFHKCSVIFPLPAYVLADEGFNVWLGNVRETSYSVGLPGVDQNAQETWDFTPSNYNLLRAKIEESEKAEAKGEEEEEAEAELKGLFNCRTNGASCNAIQKCCKGNRCSGILSGTCISCGKQGQKCLYDSECCPGTECSGFLITKRTCKAITRRSKNLRD